MQTIGILLPRSTYYNNIAFEMHAGLREGLKHAGRDDLRIITENIGFGAEKQTVYRAAEKLLLEENADVVFAYIGHRTAQLLRPLFMSANRLLIVLDAGASLPQEWPPSTHVYFHSLNNALGAWLTAERARRDGFSNGGMVTGYYDGGYLHTMAITYGFTSGGGTMAFNVATGYRKEDYNLAPLQEHLATTPDACLLGLFSGDFAEWCYRDMQTLFPGQQPPMYAAPFMFEEKMLSNSTYCSNVKGIAAWSRSLANTANQQFCAALENAGREASLFALLGWEAATLAAETARLMQEHKNDARKAGEALNSFRFESPRGNIYFDSTLQCSVAPMYEAELHDDGNGKCKLHITGEAKEADAAWKKLTALPIGEQTSGWFNSYVCN